MSESKRGLSGQCCLICIARLFVDSLIEVVFSAYFIRGSNVFGAFVMRCRYGR